MKHTLPIIEKALKSYVDKLFQIEVETDSEFNAAVKKAKDELLAEFISMRDQNPELFYLNYDKTLGEDSAKEIIKKIAQNAKNHFGLETLPTTEVFVDKVQGDTFITPSFMHSLDGYNEIPVGNVHTSKKEINQFLLSLLLNYPIKKVKYTFVDFGGSLLTDFFLKEINQSLYNGKLITDTYTFKDYLKKMQERVIGNIQQYGDVRQYNVKNKKIIEPYEIIVLLDNADKGSNEYLHDYEKELNTLKRNCAAGGVFIIDFTRSKKTIIGTQYEVVLEQQGKAENVKNIIKFLTECSDFCGNEQDAIELYNNLPSIVYRSEDKDDANDWKLGIDEYGVKTTLRKASVDFNNALVCPILIDAIPNLQKACIDYINSEAAKEDEAEVITFNADKLAKTSFEPIKDSILIPVGKKGFGEVSFRMDIVSHVHAFILGQSGSGKSVFLHDVISGAMLKYSPEDLELYLLDFKLGGVEFNRYKGEKHVHAMLVDNSDPQITLEILRELRDRMAERGKALRQAGLTNIKEYNEQHPDNKMKHILFVADECHEMFRVDDSNRAISNEISDVIVKIAKEGRNQGVHLLLATQTLANTDISNEILNNISDHYLLKCAIADSEKMVSKSSDITSKLTTGKVYYHHVDDSYIFQAFYADKQLAAEIIQTIDDKTKLVTSNETFYFSGASIFHFDSSSAIQEHARKCRKMPVAFAGKSIDIKQVDVAIPLNEDFSENILLLGLNDEYQSTRVSMNLLVSLLATCKSREVDVDFKIINCLSDDNDKYLEVLDELENAGLVDVIPAKKRAPLFKQLAEAVLAEKAKETILFILGQDRFRELKLNVELEEETSVSDDSGLMVIKSAFLTDSSSEKKSVKSFSEALTVILDKGPEVGVHTIIQLEKAANYLFEDYISPKEMFKKFKHLILLKSDENAATQLHLQNNIRLENLSKEEERLRAYYYAEESDTYTLFTPYMPLEGKDLKEFIKTL